MKKPVIMQQGTDLSALGGTTSEFNAFKNTKLTDKYEFVPMVLPKVHRKVNFQDISFYYKKIRETKPDIVQIRGAAVDGLNAQIAAKLVPGTKVLLCVHGMFSELVYMSKLKRFVHEKILEPIIFSMADGISCVHESGAQRKQFNHVKRKMLPHIYNRMPDYSGYDRDQQREKVLKEFALGNDSVIGVFCGRFTKEKGLEYLATAFEEMAAAWPENFVCVMIGDGDYREEFTSRMERAGLNEKVRCIGPRTNVPEYLFASDFMIMPSLHENHSISLLEAVASKLPVISTNVGGNPEIVRDGIEGKLCDPADAQALKNLIVEFASNRALRTELKEKMNIEKYEQFSNQAVDQQLDQVLTLMLNK